MSHDPSSALAPPTGASNRRWGFHRHAWHTPFTRAPWRRPTSSASESTGTLRFVDPSLERRFHDYQSEKFIVQSRVGIGLGILLYGGFHILDRYLCPEVATYSAIIRIGVVVPYFAIWLALSYRPFFKIHIQVYLAIGAIVAGLGHASLVLTMPSLPGSYYLGVTIILVVFIFTFSGLRLIPALFTSIVIFALFEVVEIINNNVTKAEIIFHNFVLVSMCFLGILSGYLIERYVRNEFVYDMRISQEKERAEQLLLNILPVRIADRLKAGELAIADSFPQATILFADIVHFTSLCSNKSPVDVAMMLNDLFGSFDVLVEKHGLEKIKTMGDCYVVAGGLPSERADHAEAVADFALDMQSVCSLYRTRQGEPVSMRVGIHTGAVSAGIVGRSKFIYDVWGDTVNTASRVESTCQIGRIQVTEALHERLSGMFRFTSRGRVALEGLGTVRMYYLEGRLG